MARRDSRRSGGGGGRGSSRRKRKPPAPESIVSATTFVSPKGRVYRILRTNQTDPYDPPGAASAIGRGGKPGGNAAQSVKSSGRPDARGKA
jgi:hypothetical protein